MSIEGSRVRAARRMAGLSQCDLGKRLSRPLTHASISEIETGKTRLKVEVLREIAEITGRPVSWFFEPDPLLEQLAAIEHDQWADWQRYFHGQCISNPDGSLTVPASYVAALNRLIGTPYAELPEEQKQYDRDEVMRYLPLVKGGAS